MGQHLRLNTMYPVMVLLCYYLYYLYRTVVHQFVSVDPSCQYDIVDANRNCHPIVAHPQQFVIFSARNEVAGSVDV